MIGRPIFSSLKDQFFVFYSGHAQVQMHGCREWMLLAAGGGDGMQLGGCISGGGGTSPSKGGLLMRPCLGSEVRAGLPFMRAAHRTSSLVTALLGSAVFQLS